MRVNDYTCPTDVKQRQPQVTGASPQEKDGLPSITSLIFGESVKLQGVVKGILAYRSSNNVT